MTIAIFFETPTRTAGVKKLIYCKQYIPTILPAVTRPLTALLKNTGYLAVPGVAAEVQNLFLYTFFKPTLIKLVFLCPNIGRR